MRDFDEKFASFVKGCEAIVTENQKRFASLTSLWFEIHHGNRYIKIVHCDDWNREACIASGRDPKDGISRKVYVFIDRTNGDVLKPEGWCKPAKHARGNIFDQSGGLKYMGPYGPMYLDQIRALP